MGEIDRAVLARIADLVSPKLAARVVERVRELMTPAHHDDFRARLEVQLEEAEEQAANLTEAIALGGDVPVLVGRLAYAEEARLSAVRRLQALGDGRS